MKLSDILKEFSVDEKLGLNDEQVLSSKEKYGSNELKEGKSKSIFVKFFEQFKDVLIIILIIAAILSLVVEDSHQWNDIRRWIEFIIIITVVLVNAFLGVFQEQKAEKSLEALKKMSQPTCKVIRNGQIEEIKSIDVVVGDIILVEAGDFIPADARIIESSELKVDESSLTGESLPVSKNNKELPEGEHPLGDQKNMLFASTFATNGKAKAVVVRIGMETEIGKIASLLTTTKQELTPLQNKLEHVAKLIGILCLSICAVVFVLEVISGYINQKPNVTQAGIWIGSLKESIALAVAAIPEGLAAVVTIILSIGVQKMVKHNAIVKKLPAVETLGSTNVICSDKTGTLTQNKMTVVKIYQDSLKDFSKDFINFLTTKEKNLLEDFAICCDAKIEKETNKRIGDPTELALLDAANILDDSNSLNCKKVIDLPFDSDRKLMTTVIEKNGKYIAITKGAPDVLFKISNNDIDAINKATLANREMAENALRVLALGIKEFNNIPSKDQLEKDLRFIGLVGMIDPARPEVKESIRLAKQAHIQTVMITGDHITTASAIARELGILEEGKKAITGLELDSISDEDLANTIEDYAVFARVAPKDKLRIVDAWQKNDKVVAMTGDGVNDSPALKGADIGCAMGITGTDVSKQAADMILTDDNFSTIVEAVKQGRGVYSNIKKCIRFLLSSNIGEVVVFFLVTFLGLFPMIGIAAAPLATTHLLWINLITDSLPAFALGMEKPEKDVMRQEPRHKNESLFAGKLWVNIAAEGLFIGLITLIAFLIGYYVFADISNVEPAKILEIRGRMGQTMAFMTLGIAELFHAFNMKSENTIFSKSTFNNKWLIGSFFVGVGLQFLVLYTPGLNTIFSLSHLGGIEILVVFLLSISTIVFMEIYKLIRKIVKSKGENK